MFKRIKRIIDRKAASKPSCASSRPANTAFSLESPVVRELALRVGQGQPAALVQQVAAAVIQETGIDNVSDSPLHHRIWCIVSGLWFYSPVAIVNRAVCELRHCMGCLFGEFWFKASAH